jgi:glycosyl transferase family 25
MTIPIYVLNLDRSAQRLEKIGARLTSLGQSFLRIHGVDGRTLSRDEILLVRNDSKKWTALNAGEVGCFLGHRKCWGIIAASEHHHGCILEDDAVLSDRFPEVIRLEGRIPPEMDILKLDTTFKGVWLIVYQSALTH